MPRLDKSRTRVLCDEYRYCGQVLAVVQHEVEAGGRVLFLAPGWRRDAERVWRYREPRQALTPGQRAGAPPRVTGKRRGRWEVWAAPLLDGFNDPQSIACPSCSRPPQPLDPDALDVLATHGIASRVLPLRTARPLR